jgi:hypothetical protein
MYNGFQRRIKMTKKLIDWATVPKGVKVIHKPTGVIGELLEFRHEMPCVFYSGFIEFDYPSITNLRLAPAEQQPWLVYEDGVTVVPEWAECEYIFGYAGGFGDLVFKSFTIQNPHNVHSSIIYYKLGNSKGLFKDGWTDNPNETDNPDEDRR